MTRLALTEGTSLSDVSAWRFERDMEFVVSSSSDFQPGVQGVALSALRSIPERSVRAVLICDFEEPSDASEFEKSFFNTAFGFSIARLAKEIRFGKTAKKSRIGFKALLGQCYRRQGGMLGTGKQKALVFVDPHFPTPPVLQSSDTHPSTSFPLPSAFFPVLQGAAKSIGFSTALGSQAEAPILNYVYELTKNTEEHGIPTNEKLVRSTRALFVEKIALQSGEIAARQLTPELRNFLLRTAESSDGNLGIGVACITVSDQGDGIQATLPPLPGEAPAARLNRAFKERESRKPPGETERGSGLVRALTSAFKLRALIQVSSGGLVGVEDYSTGEHKYPQIDLTEARVLTPDLSFGTSISLYVPEYSISPDQLRMFAPSKG